VRPSLRGQAEVRQTYSLAESQVSLKPAFGASGAGRGLERMTRYPNGDKPAAGYRCGLLVVVVRGIPYLGTTPLTAAEAAEVEAEESVQDIEIDDGEDAAA
jgi:hypothetical protein